ncbi:MAG TPA: peptidylprolyl isomerase [Polyangiaceae bacterium]|jgi:hypothetical protein
MQRAFSIVVALAMVALALVVTAKSFPEAGAAASAEAVDAGTTEAPRAAPSKSDAGAPVPVPTPAAEATALAGEPSLAPPAAAADLADPNGGPREVRFGVVLVTYDGAQDVTSKVRSKTEALTLANKLAEEAKADFHAAVQHGDSGSSEDIGVVTRGVLEPGSEAALFALPVGGVSTVIDTPRGYWIVKRLK